jgi:hypothetical protein
MIASDGAHAELDELHQLAPGRIGVEVAGDAGVGADQHRDAGLAQLPKLVRQASARGER